MTDYPYLLFNQSPEQLRRIVHRSLPARSPSDLCAEPSAHLHAARRRAQLPGDGVGGGRNAGGQVEEGEAVD
jgi:hypothetical protein